VFEIVYRYDPRHRAEPTAPADAIEARCRLEAGNREFAHVFDGLHDHRGNVRRVVPLDPRDLGVGDHEGTAPRQQPFAVVLGCSDARVPTELIFNRWCNELFVVRVAGNVLGSEALGSIDFAVRNLGGSVKLLVVLGHSGCGAVTAATDVFLKPAAYLDIATSPSLKAIVDPLVVVVRGARRALDLAWGERVRERPGYRRALIETAVVLNAALTSFTLEQQFRHLEGATAIGTVFGVYDLVSRGVRMPGGDGGPGEVGLGAPPRDVQDFAGIALRLARSAYIVGLLEST
jgi:carbonic anhydrase